MPSSKKLDVREFAPRSQTAYRRLWYLAVGVSGQREGAEDLVQQAFAIGIEKGLRFENETQLVAWLGGVVRRCALNDRRKRRRRNTFATDPSLLNGILDCPLGSATADEVPIHLRAAHNEFDDQVLGALNQLSADARACLLLRTIEQLSYREIATMLNMPEGTIMSLVHRSRTKLREILADSDWATRYPNRERGNG